MKKSVAALFRRKPFLFALPPMILFFILVAGRPWLPRHDSLLALMWYQQLLSNFAYSSGISLWFPHIGAGQSANLLTFGWMTPSLLLLAPLAKVFPNIHATVLYNLAMFIDEVLLLGGVYLLGSLVFKRITTVLFVAFTVTGTAIWAAQLWWNFHFYYAIPLSLFFVLKGTRKGSPISIVVGFSIAFFTGLLGNLVYCAPFQLLLVSLFTAVAWWQKPIPVAKLKIFAKKDGLLALLLLAFSISIPMALLTHAGPPHITSPARTSEGKLDYDTFLDYGRDKYLRHATGLANGFDYGMASSLGDIAGNNAVFAGTLFLTFFIIGLVFSSSPARLPFLVTAAAGLIVYLGKGSFMAPLLFYLPGISEFRHFGLTIPLTRVFLLFIAGFGFEEISNAIASPKQAEGRRAVILTGILLCLSAALVVFLFCFDKEPPFRSERAFVQLAVLAGALIVMLRIWSKGSSSAKPVLWAAPALLALVLVDTYSYRTAWHHAAMLQVHQSTRELFRTRPLVFNPTRLTNPKTDPAYVKFRRDLDGRVPYLYAVTEAVANVDVCYPVHRLDTLAPSLKGFYIDMPADNPLFKGYSRMVGCAGFPKLQLYPKALVVDTWQNAGYFIFSPKFADPFLTIDGASLEEYKVASIEQKATPAPLESYSDRTIASKPIPPQKMDVVHFSSSTLTAVVETQPEVTTPQWLYYADAWDPYWTATVNGKETPVVKANLGFKAVAIPPGRSKVTFERRDPEQNILFGVLWLGILVFFSSSFIYFFKFKGGAE